ncbi:MAG: zinc ABC transporter substrate-binding protein [Chloroflexi bacterium]|nr:zinc ABC transporter substrate-binding protein [Chloroflexota bacterium]
MLLPGGASLANGGQLHVVATHGILADVARNVAGDHAEVISLVPVGADQHGFVPRPSDLTTVAEADVVFINGAGWEESLLDAVESAGEGGNIVNASACVGIIPFGAGMGHDDHDDEHADDHDDDDHADHDHDDEHADDHDDDDHADHDHDDEHADDHDDDDHADHDHDDEHDDDHAHEHDDDEHADEHDDEHADDDDHADEHADEHDDDHADEHDDDDDEHAHDDHDEHAHDDHDEEMAGDIDCDAHDAEVSAIVGEEEDGHAHVETLGRAKDIDCLGGHDHEDDHGHHHGEGGCDPHLWMDPHNVIYWALMIRDSLSALDHDNEEAYAANAAAYAQELVALEADFIASALAELPDENRVLVTNHGSMGYFATTFGFEIVSMIVHSVSTEAEPSARDMAAVVDVVRDEGVPAIFSDIHLSDVLMNTIASETGVAVVGLHSDSLGAADGPAGTYLDYMRYNVNAIVEALKGDWR